MCLVFGASSFCIVFISAQSLCPSVNEYIRSVIDKEMVGLYDGASDCSAYNQQYLEQHQKSAAHRLAVGQMIYFLDPAEQEKALTLACDIGSNITGVKLEVSSG